MSYFDYVSFVPETPPLNVSDALAGWNPIFSGVQLSLTVVSMTKTTTSRCGEY